MLQLDAASAFLTFAPFLLSQHVPPLLKNLSVCPLLNCIIDNLTTSIGILLCKAEHLLVILEQNASVTARENPINHYTDPCKYLHFSGVTDMFRLGFCYMFENLVVPSSDKGKIHRALKISFLMRSWRRSSSITFILDIISFDQYFRSYRKKSVLKNIKSGV